MSDLGMGPPGMGPPGMGPDPSQLVGQDQSFVNRERPEPTDPRRKLVSRWQNRVKRAKRHWRTNFRRMRENMEFVEGRQWPEMAKSEKRDDRYVANICIRHVLQRTAELYPNNPTMQAKTKPKLIATTWDGSEQQLSQAQQHLMLAQQSGMPPDPNSMANLAGRRDGPAVRGHDGACREDPGIALRVQHPGADPLVQAVDEDVVSGARSSPASATSSWVSSGRCGCPPRSSTASRTCRSASPISSAWRPISRTRKSNPTAPTPRNSRWRSRASPARAS